MKRSAYFMIVAAAGLLGSCIKPEVRNSEADIESVYFAAGDDVSLLSDPIIQNNNVMLMLSGGTDVTELAPYFTLSEGASITPASGAARDFTQPQAYTVRSEDGKWTKDYDIRVMLSTLVMKYDFETYDRGQYDVFYEEVEDGGGNVLERQDIWSSGNAAISILLSSAAPSDYPTSASPGQGRNGSTAAKLTTVSTGPLGALFGKPIAAGNLFIGTFNSDNAMQRPLEATEFGFPVNKKPLKLTGWYKYDPKDKDVNGNDFSDECRIYAILYKPEDGKRLDGTNILTSPAIVARAIFDNPVATAEWKPFENVPGAEEIAFEYEESIDQEELANYKYNLAVVFSSSRYGDEFRGSIGSTLLIDDVEVVYE